MKRNLTPQELEVFQYLNDLRDSGQTNMFGAGAYIEDEFGLEKKEARKLLTTWMTNFQPDSKDYETLLINE